MYSYDIIVINNRTRLRASYSCNNYDIILVPWYNYNLMMMLVIIELNILAYQAMHIFVNFLKCKQIVLLTILVCLKY